MRPVPIPDELVPDWGNRVVIGAPSDTDMLEGHIAPVEAVIAQASDDDNMVVFTMLIQIESDDIEKINDCGGQFLLTMMGAVVPFDVRPLDVQTQEEDDSDEPA